MVVVVVGGYRTGSISCPTGPKTIVIGAGVLYLIRREEHLLVDLPQLSVHYP